jgi:hypothetical protein
MTASRIRLPVRVVSRDIALLRRKSGGKRAESEGEESQKAHGELLVERSRCSRDNLGGRWKEEEGEGQGLQWLYIEKEQTAEITRAVGW